MSKTITIDNYNLGNSLNITPFTLENVPGNVTALTIDVESPSGGQSLYMSGAATANVVCHNDLTVFLEVDESCASVGDILEYKYKICLLYTSDAADEE